MNLENVQIETENLILIPINHKYSEVIYQEFTDEISLYMIPKPANNIDEITQFINTSIEGIVNQSNLQLVALNKSTLEFIGCVGLHNITNNNPELGLWIKKGSHGRSYGLESITALINWAKLNLEYDYLKYPVDRRNFASRRIPETNNGIIKKEYKEINQKGFELDTIEYWIYK